jgi:ribose 5-phosphate isomerase A
MSQETLSPQTVARRAAAEAAVDLVRPGMTLGLGTGDTAAHAIRGIAAKKLPGLRCVATSRRSAELAAELGLPLLELDQIDPDSPPPIDLTIDGADEIDPALQLIKGGGGALLFEKLVAQASRQLVVIADEAKVVAQLGETRALPVEIVSFGARHTIERIARQPMVERVHIRLSADGASPYRTDSGHFIAEATLRPDTVCAALHLALKQLLGVVETGLFCHEASMALIGRPDGSVRTLSKATAK